MSTKIINVLKGDSFNDVFDLFRGIEAKEVIFIFPKGSRFAKQEHHFKTIKKEADQSGKLVSVMTADPVVAQYAANNGISILQAPARSHKVNSAKAQDFSDSSKERASEAPMPQPTPSYHSTHQIKRQPPDELPDIEPEEEHDDDEGAVAQAATYVAADIPDAEAILAAIRKRDIALSGGRGIKHGRAAGRPIRDIFRPSQDHNLQVKEEKEKPQELEVRHDLADDHHGEDIAEIWANRRESAKSSRGGTPRRKLKKWLGVLGALGILVVILVIYSTLGSATVTIHPQRTSVNFQIRISASTLTGALDSDLNRIPGQRFTDNKEESAEVAVTGQKDVVQKASGKIMIYNKGSGAQRLVATTRFRSSEGLVFRIPATITVPAATGSTLGAISSEVFADKPGPDYNIGPDKFTIPGFEGTPKFNQFYAQSDKNMGGGQIGMAKVVTEADFTNTQEDLKKKLQDEIASSVKSQIGSLKILDSSVIKFGESETNAKVGEAADRLSMKLTASVDTIAFRESDVRQLLDSYLAKNGNLQLLDDGLKINYVNPMISDDLKSMLFAAQVSGQAVPRLDTGKIIKDISGMNEAAIRDYFRGIKEIESTRVILSPFWVKHIPKNLTKIKLHIDTN